MADCPSNNASSLTKGCHDRLIQNFATNIEPLNSCKRLPNMIEIPYAMTRNNRGSHASPLAPAKPDVCWNQGTGHLPICSQAIVFSVYDLNSRTLRLPFSASDPFIAEEIGL